MRPRYPFTVLSRCSASELPHTTSTARANEYQVTPFLTLLSGNRSVRARLSQMKKLRVALGQAIRVSVTASVPTSEWGSSSMCT